MKRWNERADRQPCIAHIARGLQLGRTEVLGRLRNFLITDRPGHHSIHRLKEREGRRQTVHPPRSGTISAHPITGAVLSAALRTLLTEEAERV